MLKVLVNHVGYDSTGPKRFVVLSDENLGSSGQYSLIDGTGRVLASGVADCVTEAEDGAPFYYVGNFSDAEFRGADFRIQFEINNIRASSRRFGMGNALLWRIVRPILLHHLHSSRAYEKNLSKPGSWSPPGSLEAGGHFYDLTGGWFDRGAENGGVSLDVGLHVLLALSLAGARDSKDKLLKSELIHGAQWLARLAIFFPSEGRIVGRSEPNGICKLIDDAPLQIPQMALAAGFLYARLSTILGDIDLLRRGQRFWDTYHKDLAGQNSLSAEGAMMISEVALHAALIDPALLASSERRLKKILASKDDDNLGASQPGISMQAAGVAHFAETLPDHPLTPGAKLGVEAFLDTRVEASEQNAFGVLSSGVAHHRLGEAWQALYAYRVSGKRSYIEFATNAINWVLGLNPADTSCLAGASFDANADAELKMPYGSVKSTPEGDDNEYSTLNAAMLLMAIALF